MVLQQPLQFIYSEGKQIYAMTVFISSRKNDLFHLKSQETFLGAGMNTYIELTVIMFNW